MAGSRSSHSSIPCHSIAHTDTAHRCGAVAGAGVSSLQFRAIREIRLLGNADGDRLENVVHVDARAQIVGVTRRCPGQSC